MWPASLLGEALRAADPPRRRARARSAASRIPTSTRRPIALLRPAGDRRRPGRACRRARGRPCRRARDPGRRGLSCSAADCWPSCTRSTACPARLGAAGAKPNLLRLPNVGSCRARPCSASMTANYGALERVADHLPVRRRIHAAAAALEDRRARGRCSPPARSSGRWCLPATTGPASCWRRRSRSYRQPLRGKSRTPRHRVHGRRRRLAHRRRPSPLRRSRRSRASTRVPKSPRPFVRWPA